MSVQKRCPLSALHLPSKIYELTLEAELCWFGRFSLLSSGPILTRESQPKMHCVCKENQSKAATKYYWQVSREW